MDLLTFSIASLGYTTPDPLPKRIKYSEFFELPHVSCERRISRPTSMQPSADNFWAKRLRSLDLDTDAKVSTNPAHHVKSENSGVKRPVQDLHQGSPDAACNPLSGPFGLSDTSSEKDRDDLLAENAHDD